MSGNYSTRNPAINTGPAGGTRTVGSTMLIDGKTLGADNASLWDVKGTGSGSWANNEYSMSVTAPQYLIRQTRQFAPYYSGHGQIAELTMRNFQIETGVIKMAGYYSSSAVAPYNTSYDGFFLRSNGTNNKMELVSANNGVEDVIESANWSGIQDISIANYNWQNFTVIVFDFLWLGGAVERFFLKTSSGFPMANKVDWAGYNLGTIINSPNKPLRYEIRGVTAGGSMNAVCGQVSTEFTGVTTQGDSNVITTNTAITLPAGVATYPILGIRKQAAFRDIDIELLRLNMRVGSADQGRWELQENPTLSAPLTYANEANTRVQSAIGNGVITVTSSGRKIDVGSLVQNTQIGSVPVGNFSSHLKCGIDNTMSELVLCYYNESGATTINSPAIIFKESTRS